MIPARNKKHDDVFSTLFKGEYTHVLSFLLRRLPRQDAEDLAAEVFRLAWSNIEVLCHHPNPPAWLMKSTKYLLSNKYRDYWFNNVDGLLPTTPLPLGDSSESVALARRRVIHALNCLSEKERELLLMTTWDNLDTNMIAQVLDIPKSQLPLRLHRAKTAFIKAFNDEEYDSFQEAQT